MPPTAGQIILASIAVIIGCIGGVAAASAARHSGNWFGYVCAAGCATFVAGVIGQRTFPSDEAVRRLGSAAAATSTPGPFDAGVSIPVVGIHLTPVAAAGLLLAAVGLSLLLLFERIPTGPSPAPRVLRPLEEDDSI